MDVRKMRSGF